MSTELGGPSRHEEPVGPLRRDIRLLGGLLGRVLVEQDGEALLASVERVRAAARASRADGDPSIVRNAVRALDPAEQADVLRAFAIYFQLANTAEQHHRLRRRRDYARDNRPPRESLDEAFEELAGVPEDELAERLANVSLEIVLTAHPTEATRRTFLVAHIRIAALLARFDDPDLTAPERAEIEAALAEEITILWQTDEVRDRPRVVDEIRHGLWFFEESLLDAGERLLAAYRRRVPGRASAVLVRDVDRRRPRRQPVGRRRHDRARARARPRDRPPPLPGRGPRAGRDGRVEPLARRDLARARGVDRP